MKAELVKRNIKKEFNGWWIISLVGAVVILLPILFIFSSIFQEPNENWLQIQAYLLKNYVTNTFTLVVLTGILTAFLGVTLAWLTAAYDFPLKRFFRWGLILPLSIPTYIATYTYRTMLGYTGVVQSTFRNHFDYQINPEWLTVSGIPGAVFIFSLFLYPYVFMITRAFLESQSTSYIESARLLGRKPLSVFFKVVLPLSRPAIVGGTVLVIYEVLGDYGVTSYLGIHTISTAIFQTWFKMYDVDSAMRLAAWLMVIIVGIFILERFLRQGRRYHLSNKSKPLAPVKLKGMAGIAAFLYCGVVFLIGFLIPLVQLIAWAILTFDKIWDASFFTLINQTVYVAVIATVMILILSVVVANITRSHSTFSFILSKCVTTGYSIPGPIIAIGVLAIFIALDGVARTCLLLYGIGRSTSHFKLIFNHVNCGLFYSFYGYWI